MFQVLKQHLQRFSAGPRVESSPQGQPPPRGSCCRLLAINLDPLLLGQLQAPIAKRGWSLEAMSAQDILTLDADVGAIEGVNGVLVALDQGAPLAAKLAPLREIRIHSPHLPMLVLTSADSLEERVQVAQLRGDRYLAAPITPGQVMEALEQVLPCALPPEPQVLVVDHDPVTRSAITDLLSPWGMRVLGLDNPRQFWEALRDTQPDLLLLELDMPTFSGLDLCRVVRQDPQYGNLPTLMLAANPDTFTVRQVFEAGGDDLIGKPIVGPELVTRVLSRIERSRLRQQLEQMRQTQAFDLAQPSHHDPLTQVANSHHFETVLDQQWEQHRQGQAPLSLILCEVDDFDVYYQVYGQTASNTVLRRIARILHRTVNPHIDLVARCGEWVFGIVLPNTNLDGALCVSTRIQTAIAQAGLVHGACSHRPRVTLSLGIGGTTPPAGLTAPCLIKTTDQALQEAKARGGNTFCLYPL